MKIARMFVVVTFWLACVSALISPVSAQGTDEAETPSITVRGTGEIRVKPDMAQIRAGVLTRAATAAAALTENSQTMEQVFTGLAAFGIPEEDIQTSSFSIAPQYSRPAPRAREEPRIIGYQVTNQVAIGIRDLDRLGEALDRLVRLGANQIHGVQFSVSNPEPRLDQARVKAMQEARRKAVLLSQSAGVKLGRVLSIRETGTHMPRPVLARRAEASASVPIARGRETLSVTITVVFALE